MGQAFNYNSYLKSEIDQKLEEKGTIRVANNIHDVKRSPKPHNRNQWEWKDTIPASKDEKTVRHSVLVISRPEKGWAPAVWTQKLAARQKYTPNKVKMRRNRENDSGEYIKTVD